jgi:Polysaccharide lyase
MRTKRAFTTALGAVMLSVLAPAGPAHAALIWDGDAARGRGVLGGTGGEGNCGTGSITAVDVAGRGRVWRFHKPRNSPRCEVHGIRVGGSVYRFQENRTYYIGWSSRLTSTVNNNATFQWKSYGSHRVNFPLWFKMIDGRLVLLQRQLGPRESRIWSTPLRAGAWNHIVLGIHTSRADRGGWVELYYNGSQQTFTNGSRRYACRTWDFPGYNDPKWGVYGARPTDISNFVDDLKIGTTLADVR